MSSDLAYCGLDLGITTTDAVADWATGAAVSLPSAHAARSAEAAVRGLLELAPPPPRKTVRIAATGVGARALPERLAGFAVHRVPEISAIGRGGIGLGGGTEALVVSLGTGTALVSVRGRHITHVTPGNGVGGGTLRGLGKALLGTDDVAELARLAGLGDRTALDVTIGEVAGGPLGGLPEHGTASNFAKYAEGARREDVAAALVNLIAEVVLWTVLLGLQASAHSRAILTGKLVLVEPVRRRIEAIGASLGGILLVPERAPVAAALGAAWSIREASEEA
jgi:type II pantothenate kinase